MRKSALLIGMSTERNTPLDTFELPSGHTGPVWITRDLWRKAGTHDYRMTPGQSIDGKRYIMLRSDRGTCLCVVAGIVG